MEIETIEIEIVRLQNGIKELKKSVRLIKETKRLELTKEKENLIRLECEQLKNSCPHLTKEEIYEKIGAKYYLTSNRIKQIYLHTRP